MAFGSDEFVFCVYILCHTLDTIVGVLLLTVYVFFGCSLLITLMGHIKLTDFGLSKMGLMNCTFCHNFFLILFLAAVELHISVFC